MINNHSRLLRKIRGHVSLIIILKSKIKSWNVLCACGWVYICVYTHMHTYVCTYKCDTCTHMFDIFLYWGTIHIPWNSFWSVQFGRFNILTELCNSYHYLILEYFHHSKKQPCTHQQSFSIPPSSQCLVAANLLSVCGFACSRHFV